MATGILQGGGVECFLCVVAAMVYCIEFLWKNFDWLEEKLKEYEEGE